MSSVIHDSTRSTLGLSSTAPSSVTSYTAPITQSGVTINMPIVDGTSGNDSIDGPLTGYVFGFGGNDTLENENSAAVLIGGDGSDTFKMYNNTSATGFSDGSILDFEVGIDTIDLRPFSSITSFSQLTITNNTSGTAGTFAQITNTAASLNISVSGTGGLNALTANSFRFEGQSGGDDSGSGGDDSSSGGDDNDTSDDDGRNETIGGHHHGGHSADHLFGSSGDDTMYGGGAVVSPGDLADSMIGGRGSDYILGNGGDDTIYGGSGGADTLDGNDTIYGGINSDYILGNSGDDSLYGGGGVADPNDTGDTIYGGLGNDYILGNGGNDIIYGQAGNDTMHGGAGDDTYAFTSGSGVDIILHFTGAGAAGGDVIQIASGINGGSITTTEAALAAVTYTGGNAVLDLGGGNTVTIMNLAENSLIASDFTIV